MSVASEITRLRNAKASLKTAIEGKGVTVPSSTKLDAYPALVESIQAGGGYEENVWYFCCKDWANYLFTYGNNNWITPLINGICPNGRLCWFEFNGEKYYVDSFSDGTHTLTKQGAPVVCNISTFITFLIRPSGNNFVLDVAED